MQAAVASLSIVNIGDDLEAPTSCPVDDEATLAIKAEIFQRNMVIVVDKANHKDWTQKELALTAMQECFENASTVDIAAHEDFVTTCAILLRESLETNNI